MTTIERQSIIESEHHASSEHATSVPAERAGKMRKAIYGLVVLLGALSHAETTEAQETLPVSLVKKNTGSLVIAGGGKECEDIHTHFLELAGGKKARIVIITTASEMADEPETPAEYYWQGNMPSSVDLVHTRDPVTANTEEFNDRIKKATGVWISGGKQRRLMDAYGNTRVKVTLRNLLAEGGVVGGTSAGAAIMGERAIESGDPAVMGRGFNLLDNEEWIVDQHFTNRGRLDRLLRAARDESKLGIGIDENTAFVVNGKGEGKVIGKANVSVCDPTKGVQVFKPGATIHLKAFTPTTVGKRE